MMQEVQGLVFTVFCFWFSLLFHLSLTVRLASIAPEIFSIAYTKRGLECFGLLWKYVFDGEE